MPSSKARGWLFSLALLAALPAHAFDMERDTWLLPDEPGPSGRDERKLYEPLDFARVRETGNDQLPVYAQDQQAELIAAAARNDRAVVEALLQAGVNPNAVSDQWGENALLHGVRHGNVELVRVLLEAGADPDLKGRGFTPLGLAAQRGHARIARMLLRAGADVDRKSSDGNTPLSAAVSFDRVAVIRELLPYRPDFTLRNREGRTALSLAAEEGYVDALRLLLEAGVDPNVLDRGNATPLSRADEASGAASLLVQFGGSSIR